MKTKVSIKEAIIRVGYKLYNVGDLTGLNDSERMMAEKYLNNKYRNIRSILFIKDGKYLSNNVHQSIETPIPPEDLFIKYEIEMD
jgi:uncharacterized membrane protein